MEWIWLLMLIPSILVVFFTIELRRNNKLMQALVDDRDMQTMKDLQADNIILADNLELALTVVQQYAPRKGSSLVRKGCREHCSSGSLYVMSPDGGLTNPLFHCAECGYPNSMDDLWDIIVDETDELKKLREVCDIDARENHISEPKKAD